ncbi:large-conductance mechanosensitive channel protein MscL [Pseudogracilibacillus sp. ICA-222130]|uniref:large-conductance mechanosensitive channel protein MscL n=1 Tax=Pseudogracilibacillus sp. ICA-222130 TaxID=3134655 RepID=UPI0030BE1150
MLKEFKEFIAQGNVLDLAIGIIIGAAFGEIVNSLVDNIIMPIVGLFMGGIDFTGLSIQIKDAEIAYGMFIQNVVSFFIIAFSIFLFVKLINKLRRKKDEEAEEEVDENIQLLSEIRDLLKKN